VEVAIWLIAQCGGVATVSAGEDVSTFVEHAFSPNYPPPRVPQWKPYAFSRLQKRVLQISPVTGLIGRYFLIKDLEDCNRAGQAEFSPVSTSLLSLSTRIKNSEK
jgi:hypothetical protein